MAVTMADIVKLRKLTGAGMMDCKNALNDANGDFDEAMKIIREKGKAVAAKRSDREASEGCVLAKAENGYGAMIALKCETDFVANNADFIKLTQDILNVAFANKCKTLDEVKELELVPGTTVQQAVTDRSGITGEKMELDGYNTIEGETIAVYNHMNRNFLCTMVALNKAGFDEAGHEMAMQIAAMAPIAVNEENIPQEVKDNEFAVAIQKTKEEQVEKAVVAAINKAGINANLVDSEDHIESNIAKGWLTEAEAEKAREIRKTVGEQKAANLPEAMVQNIAKGRMAKFFKDVCLLQQAYNKDAKITVAEYLKSQDKELTVTDFKRFTLHAE
ncbi:MAG: elongation factor Ts [Bacteroidaceae bacterium]|nr:elongation factor Ts [Bacteroidaceae bacterium]MBR1942057.1 elongation factor Ts [Bacteroidaceae bacterium]MBR2161251.1 elongation factor Ts [Bacteroidaceae bacterium]MBR3014282.1 elongation factor Ts [Bacteroidaceae bacterium]MBR3626230.1 elongation factor Ts [Bacteroidaceae bacterium]